MSNQMTVTLNNGVRMPMVGIGTFMLNPDEAEASVLSALHDGYRLIDTANAYVNEKAVGRAIKKSGVAREDIFLETKLWPSFYEKQDAVEKTLQRLDTDYIDLLLIHQPAGNYIAGYRLMEKAYKEGKVKAIGLSNFNQEQVREILDVCEVKTAILQTEAHPYHQENELKAFLDAQKIVVQAWYPLGHGDASLINEPLFTRLAEKYGKSNAQVILRWHVQAGNVVIPGSQNPTHIKANFELFDFALTDAEMAEIAAMNQNKRYYTSTPEILRPAFQMAVDDDVLHKNPFSFELATVVVNDSVTREAITKDQMRKFLKFVHDDNVYCKYYEVVYILFHTGMRISEFCGLTLKDVDLEKRIINIDHQLQRTSDMRLIIESTKTNVGTRKLPMTEDVFRCFQAIVEDREKPRFEKMVDGYTGFLFLDKEGLPMVAMHWEHRFNHMVKRYNDIFRVQMPNITPHVCRHTYCSNMAKAGMNPKTLQYLMGHSDISVTLNTYTHLGLEDAADELKRMEELADARKELEKVDGEKTVSQKMFRAI